MNSDDIKKYGLSIGYADVGVTSVESLSGYTSEVTSRDEYAFFRDRLSKSVYEQMPEAKSIIVLVRDYFQNSFPDTLTSMIGKLYLARVYGPLPGNIEYARLELMKEFLTEKGFQVNQKVNAPARLAAYQAGLTTIGRNTFAYAGDSGSYVVFFTIAVDKELEYGKPNTEQKCPTDCEACIKACPTNALFEPYKVNPNKCIAFNNWVTQDINNPAVTSFIPHELREAIGSKIHGCDICQDVCPRNREKLKQPKVADKFIEKIEPDITLSAILNMDDDYYNRTIQPIMYNYIKDKRYFVRNAIIAMGNSKDSKYIADLERAAKSDDGMIREYALWALEKIT